jgi:multicomponent Na+:H+ antiporter subunit E
MSGARLLVPVSDSATLRNTVAYAVRAAVEGTDHAETDGESAASDRAAPSERTVHFVYPISQRTTPGNDTGELRASRELLERVEVWAAEDLGDDTDAVTVETHLVGENEYLFSPRDYAEVLVRHAREHDLEAAVFDPGYNPIGTTPLLPTLTAEVRRNGLAVEEAPVTRERRSARLVGRATAGQFLAVFGLSYAFYLLLAGTVTYTFELVTGAISAAIVAVSLWRVSLTGPIQSGRALRQALRLCLYVPYLLFEITKSNVEIAYIVLHPNLPIDPEMVEFDAAVWTPLSVATLANSITLTPGTLTVDATRRHFTIHSLTSGSKESLLDGGLERAVRFVFYGRSAARAPSPRERGDDGPGDRGDDDTGERGDQS